MNATLDIQKLFTGLEVIMTLSLEELRNQNRMTEIIQNIGLYNDPQRPFGPDNSCINKSEGLWQLPVQMAKMLIVLSDFKIRNFLEIGTFQGWTASVITSYLRRFNPEIYTITIDPNWYFPSFKEIQERLPITYIHTTSKSFEHSSFDLVLIDGNHRYKDVAADYRNAGKRASICMFHDINDQACLRGDREGSVPRFWNELKRQELVIADFVEILDHPLNEQWMGFGVRICHDAKKH